MKPRRRRTRETVAYVAGATERLEQRAAAKREMDRIIGALARDERFPAGSEPKRQIRQRLDELLQDIRIEFAHNGRLFQSKTGGLWRKYLDDAIKRFGPDAGAEKIHAARCEQAAEYLIFRRLRPPPPNGKAGAIAFSHDAARAENLRHMVEIAREISNNGVALGNGGREAMVVALEFATAILDRVPSRDIIPITRQLSFLQDALLALDEGIQHPALKPVEEINGRRLTKRPNVIGREFRYRCTLATILSLDLDKKADRDEILRSVHKEALATASIVASFDEVSGQSERALRNKKSKLNKYPRSSESSGKGPEHRGPLTFEPDTIGEWVKTLRPAFKKFWSNDRPKKSPTDEQFRYHAQIYNQIVFRELLEHYRNAYMQSLRVEQLYRPMHEIIEEQPFQIDRLRYLARADR